MPVSVVAHAEKEKLSEVYWKKVFVHASDEYFDQVYFPYQPTQGTLAGYHQYDTKLEDLSRPTIDAEIAALQRFEKRIAEMHAKASFDLETRGDCDMVLGNIRSQLLTLQTIRFWEKSPDLYSSTLTNGAFAIMERKFASPDERLRSLVARERQMPALLVDARENLKNPPRIYTEIAIEQLPGIIHFFENDVPAAFADAKDPASERGVRPHQRGRDRCAEELSGVGEVRPAAALERRLSHWRRYILKEARSTTRWSICRSTSCSRLVGPTCARTRPTSVRWRKSWSRTKIRRRCWRNSAKCIQLRTS